MPTSVFKSVYPYTQETLAEYPLMNESAVDNAITNASDAYKSWKKYSFSERANIFRNVASILRRDQVSLATLITREMGKIISEAKGEVEKCAVTAEYYADHAESFLKDELMESDYYKSFIAYQPI